ncbi:MAG: hypothetical protein HFG29_02765 [Eubacterium sp.]|nr:hypothetical protein [Eubacterium sp.]
MNISVFSSDKFYIGAKIMLTSLLMHNNFEKHNLYIVSTDIKDRKIKKLNRFLRKRFHQEVKVLKITEEMKEGFPDSKNFSAAGFHKLYVFNYLPEKLDRIMCLDADAMVMGSIKEFYYQDLGDNVLSASEDIHIKVDVQHFEEMQYDLDEPYFNMGSILIDLNKYLSAYSVEDYINWIEEMGSILIDLNKYLSAYSVEDYINWIEENRETAKYVAQDAINILFKGQIKKADYKKYNNQKFYYEKIDAQGLKELKENCSVVHCIGKIKPWDFRYNMAIADYMKEVMINNGMKHTYYLICAKRFLFNVKHKVLSKVKGV